MKKGFHMVIIFMIIVSTIGGILASQVNNYVWFILLFPMIFGYLVGWFYNKALKEVGITLFEKDYIFLGMYASVITFFGVHFFLDYREFITAFNVLTPEQLSHLGLVLGEGYNQYLVNMTGFTDFFGYMKLVLLHSGNVSLFGAGALQLGAIGSVILQALEVIFYFLGIKYAVSMFHELYCVIHKEAFHEFGDSYILPTLELFDENTTFDGLFNSLEDYSQRVGKGHKTYYCHINFKRCISCRHQDASKAIQMTLEYCGKSKKKPRFNDSSMGILIDEQGYSEIQEIIQEIQQKNQEL